jgi:nicotinate-nucleotide pyrophosphorylase (carboxylating)
VTWLDPPISAVRDVVARALAEDLGVFGDLTAGLVPAAATVRAALVARSAGVLAGRLAAAEAFSAVDAGIAVAWRHGDGDRIGPGTVIATVTGPLASVLSAERTALNLLGHLSGIASLTRRYVDAAGDHTRVRDTRKTTPGLRALEKAAVRAGGGVNHRASLSEGILVKDNHLAGLTIGEAVSLSKRRWPGQACEVECDTLEQVEFAMAAGADMVLVDNMTPSQVAEAVGAVGGRVPVEVSGGVTLGTIGAYAAAGADLVAVGAITHSAPVLDIGLDLEDGPCSSPST